MRLTALLLEHLVSATPATYALVALMCLDTARLPSRLSGEGNLLSLIEQDRSVWDQQLIDEGAQFLARSATGTELTEYHIEAAIALIHAAAPRVGDTDWSQIVSLYDQLSAISRHQWLHSIVQSRLGSTRVQRADFMRFGPSWIQNDLQDIPSILWQTASSNFAGECAKPRAGTFRRHFPWPAIKWKHRFIDGRIRACQIGD